MYRSRHGQVPGYSKSKPDKEPVMRIIVNVCNDYALEESVFIADETASKAEHRDIRLPKERFHLQSDQVIALSISNEGLTFVEENSSVYCHITTRSKSHESTFSKDTEASLKTRNGECLTMHVFFGSETAMSFYKTERSRVISLGKGLNQNICCIDSDLLSDAHMILRRTDKGDQLNVKGESGCYLNGRHISSMNTAILSYGDAITVGSVKLLWLNDFVGIDRLSSANPVLVRLGEAACPDEMYMTVRDKGVREHIAPPRNLAVPDETVIRLDPPPPRKEIKRQPAYTVVGPALTMAIPMCLGCGLYIYSSKSYGGTASYMYTGLVTALTSALLGAMWAFVNIRNARRQERAEEELRVSSYRAYIESCNKQIRDKYRYNSNAMKRNDPSLPEFFASASLNVFNRRKNDENLFIYRVGTGSIPFDLKIEIPEDKFLVTADELMTLPSKLKNKYRLLNDVPICVDILKNEMTGFVSESDSELLQLFLNITLQIASTTGPDIVRLVFLLEHPEIYGDFVDMLTFLPQTRGEDEHYVGYDRERSEELTCSLETTIRGMEHKGYRWIVFTDDIRLLPISVSKREDVSVLIFAKGYDSLPGDCTLIVQNDDSYRGMISIGTGDGRCDVNYDRIGCEDACRYIRSVASMRIRTEVLRGAIPLKVTLPDLFDKSLIPVDFIKHNWARNDTGNSLMAPIGRGADDRKVYLDIHEKAHGPHGLIAGMTGSGKSELLATYILSLSVRYSPLELGFLLIDYKGGGMAGSFKDLPHLRGSISNLSGNMIGRALVSIRSENLRRQKLFLKAGVNSITDYLRMYRTGRVNEPLPHIIIIIDEFAELKRNEPDFMRELISVAQVGRSLGVHLILATQKPAGTVDDNIFSNSRFRICLRVQDKQDSNDMLHRPDASFIRDPGRAFLQVGNDELFDEFQAGYTMEPYEEDSIKEKMVYLIDRSGHRQKIVDEKAENAGDEEQKTGRETHFSRVLKNLNECGRMTDLSCLKDLWLPPLEDTVVIKDENENYSPFNIMAGMYDKPSAQTQGEYRIDLLTAGHQVICGSPLSGKSTLLQTMLYGYIKKCTPYDLNIYIVDYSNGVLSALKDSNLVGAYFTEEEEGRLPNLFCMLTDILKRRRKEYVGVGFTKRRQFSKDPAVLLVIDNYGRFREKTECRYDSHMLELVKFAETYGIYIILSGSSIGSNDIPPRLFEDCRNGICLRMNDKYQYSECLRQVRLPLLPKESRGRGLAVIGGEILEFQTAVCCEGDDAARSAFIKAKISKFNEKYKDMKAMRVPFIPEAPTIHDLEESIAGLQLPGTAIGYETISGKPVYIEDGSCGCLVIAGRSGSGRTNTVKVYEYFAVKRGLSVKHADDVPGFLQAASCTDVVILENAADAIEAFYAAGHWADDEAAFLSLLGERNGHRYVFTLSDRDYARLAGFSIYEKMISECRGIYLSGGLDKQNIFDYSYLSFTDLCTARPKGTGTILKINDTDYFGDVVIPAA